MKQIELQRISTIAKTLGPALEQSAALKTAALKSAKLVHSLEGNSKQEESLQHKHDDNALLQQLLQTSAHLKKMQMRRKETILTMDGIAPNLNNIDSKSKLQEENMAENVNFSSRLNSTLMDSVYELYDFIYNITDVSIV